MSVLFMMPTWSAPSELWIQRMIEALEPNVATIASWEPEEKAWRGRIPSLRLKGDNGLPRLNALEKAANSNEVTSILVHYLPFALRFNAVWEKTCKPLFVHCHGYDVTWDRRHHDNPNEKFHTEGYQQAVRSLSDRAVLIANSKWTVNQLRKIGVTEDRIVIKYLGVPVPVDPPIHAIDSSWLNILYLGRLVDFKGPDLTIKAFELACERGLRGRLILAGDGPLREDCERLKQQSKYSARIRLVGSVSANCGSNLRHHAHILTMHNQRGPQTRQHEAFGVSIIEAMADGLPVVTGRDAGPTETVIDGETGILVEPGNIGAHAEAMLLLAENGKLRSQMGMAGWQRAGALFSQECESARLKEILKQEIKQPDCENISIF